MSDIRIVLQKTLDPNNDERHQADRWVEEASKLPGFLDSLLETLSDPHCQFPAIAFLKQTCHTPLNFEEHHKIIMHLLNIMDLSARDPHSSVTKPFLRLVSSVVSLCMGSLESACLSEGENANSEVCLSLFNEAQNSLVQLFDRLFSSFAADGGVTASTTGGNFTSTIHGLYLLQELMTDLPASAFVYQSLSTTIIPMLFKSLLLPSLEVNIQCETLSDFFIVATEILAEAYNKEVSKELEEAFDTFFDVSWELVFSSSRKTVAYWGQNLDALNRLLLVTRFVVHVLHHNYCSQTLVQANIIPAIVNGLFDDVDFFASFMLDTNDADPDGIDQEKGQLFSFVEHHLSCRWSFLSAMIETGVLGCKKLLSAFGHQESENVRALLQLILHYSSIPNAEAIKLTADPNFFLKEEEDRVIEFPSTLRDHVAHLGVKCIKTLGPNFVTSALDSIASVLLASDEEPRVREREAALFLLYFVIKECRKKKFLKDVTMSSYGLSSLLLSTTTAIIRQDAMHGRNPLQVARALLLLPRALSLLSLLKADTTPIKRELASLCVATLPQLSLSSAQLLVKVSTLKSLFSFSSLCTLDELSVVIPNTFPSMMTSLCDPHWEGECLYAILETMTALLRTHRHRLTCLTKEARTDNGSEPVRERLLPSTGIYLPLIECWSVHLSDPNVGELVHGVFKEFLRSNQLFPMTAPDPSLFSFLQWMRRMLQNKEEGQCIAREIIKMLIDFFKGKHFVGMPEEIMQVVLEPLSELVLSADFASLLSVTLKCLTCLLEQLPHSTVLSVCIPVPLMQYCLGDEVHERVEMTAGSVAGYGRYAVTTVLTATALRILDSSVSEVELLDVKHSLAVIMERNQEFSHIEIKQLVRAITSRLQNIRSTIVAQELLIPLSVLFEDHRTALVELWISSGEISEIFQLWLGQLPRFSGVKDLVRSAHSLLLSLQDETVCSRLAQCTLKNWVIPTSCHVCEQVREKRRPKRKTASSVTSGTPSSPSDRRVEEIPLNAAVFISVGKAILSIAQQWNEAENGELWEEEEMEDSNSSVGEEGSESEGDDDDSRDNTRAEVKTDDGADHPERSRKRKELILQMQTCFHCVTTTSMSIRYGERASTLLTPTELSAINSFLSSLIL